MPNAWEKQSEQEAVDMSKVQQVGGKESDYAWSKLKSELSAGKSGMEQYSPENLMNYLNKNVGGIQGISENLIAPQIQGYQDILKRVGEMGFRQGEQDWSSMNALYSPAAIGDITNKAYALPTMQAYQDIERQRAGMSGSLLDQFANQFYGRGQQFAGIRTGALSLMSSFADPTYMAPYYTPDQPGWLQQLLGIGAGAAAQGAGAAGMAALLA